MMKPIQPNDILPNPAYEQVRDAFRRAIIEHKRDRRVTVGPQMTFVFENRKTMKFQVQEILRAESITEPDAIAAELAVYNALLPDASKLAATLLIEFTATERVRRELGAFVGVPDHISLRFGGHEVRARREEGRETEEKISAVQYLFFDFDADARAAFLSGTGPVRLCVDHPAYPHEVELSEGMRRSLCEDLQAD